MLTTEFRIGNYAQGDAPNVLRKIKAIDRLMIGFVNDTELYNIRDVKPAPLTEGVLRQFGFDWMPNRTNRWMILHIDVIRTIQVRVDAIAGVKKVILTEDGPNDTGIINMEHIKHVHQLQNLYHSVTAKELALINEV